MPERGEHRKVFSCTQAGARQKSAPVSSFLRWGKDSLDWAGLGWAELGSLNPGVLVLILCYNHALLAALAYWGLHVY